MTMPTAPAELVCLGEPMMEFNQQPDGRYLRGHGGDTANCAVAAARSGATVGMLAHLGDDRFGHSFLELWQSEGIDATGVALRRDAPTGIYFVEHDDTGHHFSYRRNGSAASRMTATELPFATLDSARILHVSGISQAISDTAADSVFAAIERVRAAGGQVSYDCNLRLALWPLARARAVIHEAMAQCDIALPGLDDARQLTGLDDADAIVDFYLQLGATVVALTMGMDGTLVATAQLREHIAPYPVNAVDATAAGDTFDGAFLAEWLRHGDAFRAARYANAAAALSTLGYGAVGPMPTRSDVEAFLADRA